MTTNEHTPQEKAAWVAWQLATGAELTTHDIIERFDTTRQGAEYILNGLSRVVPIIKTESRWCRFNHT